jgi:DNA repair protein RadC
MKEFTSIGTLENAEPNKKPSGISDTQILYWAESILIKKFTRSNYLTSPNATRDFLRVMLAKETREVFTIIFLDNQNGVLGYQSLFQGVLAQT